MFCVLVMRAVWRREVIPDDGLKGSKHVGLFIKSVLSDFRPLLRRNNTTAKHSPTKRSKSMFTPLILTVG